MNVQSEIHVMCGNLAFILNMNLQDTIKSIDSHNNRNNKNDRGVRHNCQYEKKWDDQCFALRAFLRKAPSLNEQSAAAQQSVFAQTNKNLNHFPMVFEHNHILLMWETIQNENQESANILLNHSYCARLIIKPCN